MKKFLHLIIFALAANGLLAYTVVVDNNGRLKAPSPATFKLANDILSVGGFLVNIDTTPTINPASYNATYIRSASVPTPYYFEGGRYSLQHVLDRTYYDVLRNSSSATPSTWSTISTTDINLFKYSLSGGQSSLKAAYTSGGSAYSGAFNYEDRSVSFMFWTDAEFKVLDAEGNLIYWVSTQWGAQMGTDYTTHPAADLNAKIYYTSPENEANGEGKGREWIEYVHNDTDARTIYEHAQGVTGVANPTIGGIVIKPNFEGTTVGGTVIKEIFGKDNGNQYIFLRCSPMTVEKSASGYAIWRTIVPVAIQGDD